MAEKTKSVKQILHPKALFAHVFLFYNKNKYNNPLLANKQTQNRFFLPPILLNREISQGSSSNNLKSGLDCFFGLRFLLFLRSSRRYGVFVLFCFRGNEFIWVLALDLWILVSFHCFVIFFVILLIRLIDYLRFSYLFF